MKVIKVIVPGDGLIGWEGGIHFLRNLLNALIFDSPNIKYEVFLLLSSNSAYARAVRGIKGLIKSIFLIKFDVSKFKSLNYEKLDDALRDVNKKIHKIYYAGTQNSFRRVIRAYGPDVVLPSTRVQNRNFETSWVGYFADLQHKYYPEYFSENEIKRRDIFFQRMLTESKVLMVNANAVRTDIFRFYSNIKAKIFVLPFSPIASPEWFLDSRDAIQKYKLPKKYFMISNQFWAHKNHITAFRAVKFLISQEENLEVGLVCTGNTSGAENVTYFSDLVKEIESMGISKNIIFLGHVPKLDQVQIMKKCIALIQPTLFEGGPGGGSVYDALSIGIKTIVSDIEVNREIDDELNTFFKAEDHMDLAIKMLDCMNNPHEIIDAEVQKKRINNRLESLSKEIEKIVDYAISK